MYIHVCVYGEIKLIICNGNMRILCVYDGTFTRLSHETFQSLPKRRVKEIPRDFGFDLDRLAHGGIIIASVRKSLRNGKKTSASLKKVLRNNALI